MKSSARPLRASIQLDAILENYRYAKTLAPKARALAVIKANAYGHGAVKVARALAAEADGFAVASLEEALELRDSGIQQPILLLEGVFSPDELGLVDSARLSPAVHSMEQIGWIRGFSAAKPLDCWIKIDTGMHRLGFAPREFAAAHGALAACGQVGRLVAMTHFSRADEPAEPYTGHQLQQFAQAVEGVEIEHCLANSAAILTCPDAHGDWTRPGIMLYGASPCATPHPSATRLRPAMTLESALIAIRDLPAGEPVGYGGRFVADRPMRIGVVAVGYADGYPRHARDGTPVAVNGQRTRVVGRVSMDMITLDLTDLRDAQVGDPVELWGEQILASEVAQWSDTIAYQLFTSISRRVPLKYADD